MAVTTYFFFNMSDLDGFPNAQIWYQVSKLNQKCVFRIAHVEPDFFTTETALPYYMVTSADTASEVNTSSFKQFQRRKFCFFVRLGFQQTWFLSSGIQRCVLR
jgi:hypothetical protein